MSGREEAQTSIPVKGTSFPSLVTMKERVGRLLSNTLPNLTTFRSLSPTFLTVATTLISEADETLSAGVERDLKTIGGADSEIGVSAGYRKTKSEERERAHRDAKECKGSGR